MNLKSIKNKYINEIVNKLAADGQAIINNAYYTKTTKNRTFNEHDAFVYGVYCYGKLMKYGFVGNPLATEKAHGWKAKGIEEGFGRDWAEEAIRGYKATPKSLELVVLVCTFYSQINEGKGYRIISQTLNELDGLASEYKGKVKLINL